MNALEPTDRGSFHVIRDQGQHLLTLDRCERRVRPAKLWDLHGAALFAMACVLLGEETAALRAVTLGMADLYRPSGNGPAAEQALCSAADCVYRQCHQLFLEDPTRWSMAEPPVMARLGEIAPSLRQILALCLFGGHTYREAATLLDLPADTVARLLNSGLHELTRLIAPGAGMLSSEPNDAVLDRAIRMSTEDPAGESGSRGDLRDID